MERVKMPRSMRAKQFAPFDALKGLREALALKEYEHEKTLQGDLSEEKIQELSSILLNLDGGQLIKLTYFKDGYNKEIIGNAKINFTCKNIKVGKNTISFLDIVDISLL